MTDAPERRRPTRCRGASARSWPIPREQRTPAQVAAVFSYWRTTVPEWKDANDRIEALWKQHPEGATQLVARRRATSRATTHILKRGDFLKPGKPVDAGVPAFLHPLPADAAADRLTFAHWLVDRRSPTTARAFVNRVWQAYFGTGLVAHAARTSARRASRRRTPSCSTGWPSSSWSSGWSLKHAAPADRHLGDLSAVVAGDARAARDATRTTGCWPAARGSASRREIVRDIALAASGLLNPKVGGPSVFPPAPAFLFQPPASYGPYDLDRGDGRRPLPPGALHLPLPLDAVPDARRRSTPPTATSSCVRRRRSNTPLQALTTLNEPIFVECAGPGRAGADRRAARPTPSG